MSYDKIKVRDYRSDAPPGTYGHAGIYCWLCWEQTAHYRPYKAGGPFTCTECGALEGFGPEDLDEAVRETWAELFARVNNMGTIVPETLDPVGVAGIRKWARLLDLLIQKRREARP
jgi:hypothetical protein